MSNFLKNDSLEHKIARVKLYWSLVFFFLLIILTMLFLLYIISLFPEFQKTPVEPGPEVITNPFQVDLAFISTILFLLGLIVIFTSSSLVKTHFVDQLVNPVFLNYNIKKFKKLEGEISIDDDRNIKVSWSNKGYFILTYEHKPVAFAKSTELYWKILYLRHSLALN